MIEKLEQLTIDQFIDLVCGKVNVILDKHEVCSPEKIAMAVRNIIIEYRDIADPGDVAGYIRNIEEWIKARMQVILWTMASNLVMFKDYDRARAVLEMYGLPSLAWNEKRIEGEVKSRLAKAQRLLGEIDAERERQPEDIEKIRSRFDCQTASLMAHFKFQIDTSTMRATIYAHLVARHNDEIKTMKKNMNKK